MSYLAARAAALTKKSAEMFGPPGKGSPEEDEKKSLLPAGAYSTAGTFTNSKDRAGESPVKEEKKSSWCCMQ